MKRFAAGMLAVLCLFLSGCSTWMDGSYVSITPHMKQNTSAEPGISSVADYDELVSALSGMVEYGTEDDVFFVVNYNQDRIAGDMLQAEYEIKNRNPIGAYAVEGISYEIGVNGGQSAIAVSIEYRRSRAEILRIQTVRDIDSASKAISAALNKFSTDLVLAVENYQSTDFEQLVYDYADENPDLVMEVPQVIVTMYPEQGETRVVEMKFTYQTSRKDLRNMQSQVQPVFDSAALYVSGDASAHEKYNQLYVFLMERYDYKLQTSITPAYSLLRHGVGDCKAFAVVFGAMCRQAGLECLTVSGTREGEPWFWNIVQDDGLYYHVDLLRCADEGAFRELSDGEMEGYVWDYSAYPTCGQQDNPELPPTIDGIVLN